MRFVQDAVRVPNRCAFYPQIGPQHPEGFVASDMLVDDHFSSYVSIVALREIADKIPQAGLVRKEFLTVALAEAASLRRENEDLREQMAAYDQELDAITVLKARGYKPTQRPGRKPNAQKAA